MNPVIPVGFQLEWAFPVCVRTGALDDKHICGPRAALKYLRYEITRQSGQPYWSAIAACNSALLYRSDLDRARDSFIAAYADYICNVPH
jgi:hypothetical protein